MIRVPLLFSLACVGWLTLNAEYAKKWPNITLKGEPPADAKEFDGVKDKFEKYFSDKPGSGS